MDTMNAQRTKLSIDKRTLWIRIPYNLADEIEMGCDCNYCKSHPHLKPKWDTIAVDLINFGFTWTVHYPDF